MTNISIEQVLEVLPEVARTPTPHQEDEHEKKTIDVESLNPITEPIVSPPNPAPDGGWQAWSTVVGVFLISSITFGIATIWGFFQNAYTTDPSSRFRHISPFNLGWVGGSAIGCAFIAGPFGNVLISKFGIKAPMILGVLMMSLGLELASISKEYWQLLLSQGIMFGLGVSLAYIPSIGLPAQWFAKRRALATGIASAGSGVGALVLTQVANVTVAHLSISWALRIIGFICFGLGALALMLIQKRTTTQKVVQYKVFDLSVLRVPGLLWYMSYVFVQGFGFITPLFFISSYSHVIGLTAFQGADILSITTALNSVGRIVAGQAGDQAGTVNILILFNFLTGLSCLVVWLFASQYGAMVTFAVIWGTFSGAFWALSVPTCAKIVGLERLGSAVSIQFLMNVIPPIFAVPIGTRIIAQTAADAGIKANTREAYRYLIILCGLMSIISSFLLVPVRVKLNRRLWAKV